MKTKDKNLVLSDLYRLLSLSVSYPDAETYSKMETISRELKFAFDPSDELYQFLIDLHEALPGEGELIREYSRIFIVGGLAINESAVCTRFNAVSEVGAYYAAFGFMPKSGEAPDSLMHELEFAALLYLKLALAPDQEAKEVTTDALNKFVDDHLLDFSKLFSEKMLNGDAMEFYRVYARLLAYSVEKAPKPLQKADSL